MYHDDNVVFDRFAQGIIHRKILQLIGRAGLTKQDYQDLKQELTFRLLQSMERFDAEKAHVNVFTTIVVERAVAMMLRERRAKKRDAGVVYSLDQKQHDESDNSEPSEPRTGEGEAIDLAMDLASILAQLPEELRDLAERLQSQSISQVAREVGVPRTTLYGEVQKLRRRFEKAGLQDYL